MPPRTKIICTLGPSVASKEKMVELIQAGMNVARFNMSHGDHETHRLLIDNLKAAREETNQPVAIMLDTKGPEVRIGKVKEGGASLEDGSLWRLVKEDVEGDQHQVSIRPSDALVGIPIGEKILFDDGYIISHVVEVTEECVTVKIDHGGVITSNKGVNVPGTHLNTPDLTEQDIKDIKFGCEHDVAIIAV